MQDDRIQPLTRIVLAIVIPFLLLAFLILFFFPEQSGERFAWAIKPNMTAVIMASGYLGGAYQFAFAVFGKRWHRISGAFAPVTAFTIGMMAATILHWDRFDPAHFPFQVWLVLYIITPFLVPFLWFRNRAADPGVPEQVDAVVPSFARAGMAFFGILSALTSLFLFITPTAVIPLWPWALTPLTARVMGGWCALLAVGGLTIVRDSRWSSWRIALQSIMFWAILVLIGAFRNLLDFAPAGLINPFIIGLSLSIALMLVFHIWMDAQRKPGSVR
jgi:hypothetical protein